MLIGGAEALFKRDELKKADFSPQQLKLPALVSDVRHSIVEILNLPPSEFTGHQAFKADQKTLALWAADCAEHVLPFFEEKYPTDNRPKRAIEACRAWAETGVFKMAAIRKASLDSHAAARDAGNGSAACYAARSAGQAVVTAHVPTHSVGAAVYAIKAAAAHSGLIEAGLVEERDWQRQRLVAYAKQRGR
jgi:hypothetical protein